MQEKTTKGQMVDELPFFLSAFQNAFRHLKNDSRFKKWKEYV